MYTTTEIFEKVLNLSNDKSINELAILNEKLYEFQQDVEYIYNKIFKSSVNNIKKKKSAYFNQKSIDIPTELKSDIILQAYALNPVTFSGGFISSVQSSNYNPVKKNITVIVNTNLMSFYISNNRDLLKTIQSIDPKQRESARNEFSEPRLKGVIAHELSHWLNDTFHHYNITDMIKRTQELRKKSGRIKMLQTTKDWKWKKAKIDAEIQNVLSSGRGDSFASAYEIDAQIYAIKQIKLSMSDNAWDKIDFKKLISLDPPLLTITTKLKNQPEILKKWKKLIFTRMSRENLLSKRMQ